MPTYDYFCPANGRTLEVQHPMCESVSTWGELCRHAGIDPAGTAADVPVQRLISAAAVHTSPAPELPCGRSRCACA